MPLPECDLVLKGGVTSGAVYPRLLLELARRYRFVNIGGTSAGAIAAALAAAAERGRDQGGFERLAGVPAVLQEHLAELFQPHPRHARAFRGLLRLLARRERLARGLAAWLPAVPALWRILKSALVVHETGYGLCPGTTQPGHEHPGLTDWLHRTVEEVAGGGGRTGPLTFGELERRRIRLRMVATDLSGGAPVLLPFADATWLFDPQELAELLPAEVVEWLVAHGGPAEEDGRLRKLPPAERLPVLLAVRASVAFPGLLAAVPLWRRDFTLRLQPGEMQRPRRCWLSDGGISSNFPIHLFDRPLPNRPTFGISLESFDPQRHHPDATVPRGRVFLPAASAEGTQRPIGRVTGLLGFAAAIFDTARNWQDTLQSYLPGYRERIVRIALTPEEGGLNLEMDPATIAHLMEYGRIAGAELAAFDFDEHRWRRLLSLYAALEDLLETVDGSCRGGFLDFAESYEATSYRPSRADRDELMRRLRELERLAGEWSASPLRERWAGTGMPRPRATLKLVPPEHSAGTAPAPDRPPAPAGGGDSVGAEAPCARSPS